MFVSTSECFAKETEVCDEKPTVSEISGEGVNVIDAGCSFEEEKFIVSNNCKEEAIVGDDENSFVSENTFEDPKSIDIENCAEESGIFDVVNLEEDKKVTLREN
jgi:hypothetical protein